MRHVIRYIIIRNNFTMEAAIVITDGASVINLTMK